MIEIKSESNTWAELRERASLCLANGCLEFWMVNDKSRTITVITPDGKSAQYNDTDCIPLPCSVASACWSRKFFDKSTPGCVTGWRARIRF